MTAQIYDLSLPRESAESAHALLERYGLPEDVISSALALHARELAHAQRAAHDERRPYYHMGLPCLEHYQCGVKAVIDLIDPAKGDI